MLTYRPRNLKINVAVPTGIFTLFVSQQKFINTVLLKKQYLSGQCLPQKHGKEKPVRQMYLFKNYPEVS